MPRKSLRTATKLAQRREGAERTCRVCGCTNQRACPGGCYWTEADLCSECTPRGQSAFELAVSEIAIERKRQRHLLHRGKIKFNCAAPNVPHDKKLRVLTEELGEVARAIDMEEREPGNGWRDELRSELTQVAAVSLAWLESLAKETEP
jgi:hypothetical protein